MCQGKTTQGSCHRQLPPRKLDSTISLSNFGYPYHANSNNSDETRSGQHAKVTCAFSNARALNNPEEWPCCADWQRRVSARPSRGAHLKRRLLRQEDDDANLTSPFVFEKDANLTSSGGRSLCTNFFCNEITDLDRYLEEELINSGLLN